MNDSYLNTFDNLFYNVNNNSKPIRNPVDGGSTFSLTCTFSMGLLAKIYEYLGDGEMERREFKAFFVDFQNKRDIASHNLDMII